MEVTQDDIRTVQRTVKTIRAKRSTAQPCGFTWDDVEQETYVRLLKDEAFDESKGSRLQRIIAQTWYAYYHLKETENTDELPTDFSVDPEYYDDSRHARPLGIPEPEDHRGDEALTRLMADDFLGSLTPRERETLSEPRPPRNSAARRLQSLKLRRIMEKLK